jgi:hypothetical protein
MTGTTDPLLGPPISRRGADIDPDAVGLFVNDLTVRFELPSALDPLGCLDAVVGRMREVRDNLHLDPGKVLEALKSRRGAKVGMPFRMVFAWDEVPSTPRFAGLESGWALEFNDWSVADLTVTRPARQGPCRSGDRPHGEQSRRLS